MIGRRSLGRMLAAGIAALSLGCGLAVAGAGVAQAAVPNYWGFALVVNPSGPVSAVHWAESHASPTPTATAVGPGLEVVHFRSIGYFKGGVVHVTAVTDQFAWCQAQTWGPLAGTENVEVRCFVKGVPAFVPFTVMVSESSGTLPGGLLYAYVYYSTSIQSSYNSKGLANAVSPMGTGVWKVRLHGPGPAPKPSGGVQVTAVDAKPRICDVGGRTQTATQQIIVVKCYNKLGMPAASGWTLSYQRGRAITGTKPRLFAYTDNNKPLLLGPYVPAPPAVNFNSAGATNTIQRAGTGQSLVKFPRVGLRPDIIFVTAVAPGPKVCNLNTVWATTGSPGDVLVRDVTCYKALGAMAATESFVTYTGKV